MRYALRREDGFVRELVWVAVIIGLVAVVALDAISLFATYQRMRGDARDAAIEARRIYVQTGDTAVALSTAKRFVIAQGDEALLVSARRDAAGQPVFTVRARRHADTFAFSYLRFVPGLKDWVKRTENPEGSATSTRIL